MRIEREDLLYIAVIAVLVLFFMWDAVTEGAVFYRGDLTTQFFPWHEFAKQEVQKGNFPLWNPYSQFGTPFHANPQVGLFYPLNLPFYFLPYLSREAE